MTSPSIPSLVNRKLITWTAGFIAELMFTPGPTWEPKGTVAELTCVQLVAVGPGSQRCKEQPASPHRAALCPTQPLFSLQEQVCPEDLGLLWNTDLPGRRGIWLRHSHQRLHPEPTEGKVTASATESRVKTPGLGIRTISNSITAIKSPCNSRQVMPLPWDPFYHLVYRLVEGR